MKYSAFVIAALLIVGLCAPIPTTQQDGVYNMLSRLAYCENRSYCLHEIGHAMDQQAGWVSQSPEFYQALQLYLYTELQKPLTQTPAEILAITYRGGDGSYSIKMEIYAYLFQWAQGKPEQMPEALRPFYDWDNAARLMQFIQPDRHLYWLI